MMQEMNVCAPSSRKRPARDSGSKRWTFVSPSNHTQISGTATTRPPLVAAACICAR